MRVISIPPEPTRLTSPVITDAVSLLRAQVHWVHRLLEETLADLTSEPMEWAFPGWSHAIGLYTHALCVEDATIHALLQGGGSLLATTWADQVKWSPPPPRSEQGDQAWACRVEGELTALRRYAAAVYTATDQYVAALSPEGLVRTVDLSRTGLGQPTAAWVLSRFVLGELASACSALSVVKLRAGIVGAPTSAASSSPAPSGRTPRPDSVCALGLTSGRR